MDLDTIKQRQWWNYLGEGQRCLLEESLQLLFREEKTQNGYHDFAFVVFPAAKAYEGFLKKLFLDLGLISTFQYESNHLRIGKALNPELPKRYRNKSWVYEGLTRLCQNEKLPNFLWSTWKQSRNSIFHWFPREENFISLQESKRRVGLIIEAMDMSFQECKTNRLPQFS